MIPKSDLQAVIESFERLAESNPGRLGASISESPSSYRLVFKKTGYNWLAFSLDEPPSYDARGQRIPQTQVGDVFFRDSATRDAAFLVLNGKIMFAYWCLVGDDFHLTRWMFETLPIDVTALTVRPDSLAELKQELTTAMDSHLVFKLNAGKQIGSYNLARCRTVTDKVDRWVAATFGLSEVLPDIELMYAQMVKTTSDDEADE
jgi:hypothetical protein